MTEFQDMWQPEDSETYREGAGMLFIDQDGKVYSMVKDPYAPRMEESIDISGAGISKSVDGYGATAVREAFGEFQIYDSERDVWHLPDVIEDRFEIEVRDGERLSELLKRENDKHLEGLATDYVINAMTDTEQAYNPRIETIESGDHYVPPEHWIAVEEADGDWTTGAVREMQEGTGGDSIEWLDALQIAIPENADIYDGEAFYDGESLRKQDEEKWPEEELGEWKTSEEQEGEWFGLERFVAGFEASSNWEYREDGEAVVLKEGEKREQTTNREAIEILEERNGLKNGLTVKMSAFDPEGELEEMVEEATTES